MRKIFSMTLAVIILCSAFSINTTAEQVVGHVVQSDNPQTASEDKEYDYDDYLSDMPELAYTNGLEPITAIGGFPATMNSGNVLNASVFATEAGWYEFDITYMPLSSNGIAFSLSLDGRSPFDEAKKLTMPSYWVNRGEARYDSSGNQVSPEQVLCGEAVTAAVREYTGVLNEPYRFYLTKGSRTFSLSVLYGSAELTAIKLVPVSEVPEYKEYIKQNRENTDGGSQIEIQGEDAVLKNCRALIALSDKRNANMTPADAVNGKLNYIGGSNWKNPGDSISWEIEVGKTGYYRLGMRYRQSEVVGSPSYRELKIDGKMPFQEAENIKFTYSTEWNYTEFGGEEPYLFYLEKGKHMITLTVTGGDMISVYKELREITASLGELYVDITMIVGETVDVQRSYELFKQIPDFNKRLKTNIEALTSLSKRVEQLQERTSGTNVSIINSAVQTLTLMLENPYSAHKYKSSFYNSYTNLSAQMGSMLNMPLDIDCMYFIPNGTEYEPKKASFFKHVGFSVSRFLSSFAGNYNMIENSQNRDDKKSLTIWVNWGRDQAQALNNAILNSFEPEYGIPVNVKVVNATLIQAILSGKGPDVMLQMQRSEPVDLAMRGGLTDLAQFEDFGETVKLFREGATVPYEYRGGTYALPDTQSFYMMFARTDILSQLGIEIPETWDEFITVLTLLQRSNLQVCVPQSLAATMLIQNNLSYYNDELNGTALARSENISVLKKYLNFFTEYKVPVTMDFYNRFRIGSAPLGIANYTLGTQFQAAAPEIDGYWSMSPLPGTADENGNINYRSAGEGTGCGITKLSQNKEAAWTFLKWWVNADTQIMYSYELETTLGPLGRLAVSNSSALSKMSWEPEMLEQINKQWAMVKEMPQIAGSYYVDRSITQIFWNVVEMDKNTKDTIVKWASVADSEISRKQKEYEKR